MTFVADDAALATGGRRLSGDAIGCGPQLGKPELESAAGRRSQGVIFFAAKPTQK
ncbi:hypothetical protein ACWCXB_05925 [Streptomyces sp. NPDC001514]